MTVGHQNCRNQVSLIVGNLAAAIDAENRTRRRRTCRRMFVDDVYRNLGPLYFRRAYCMTYESFCHLHHKTFRGIKAAARTLRKYQLRGLKSSNHTPPPVPNGPIPTSIVWHVHCNTLQGGLHMTSCVFMGYHTQ